MERERARAATAETALQQLAGSRPRDGATALAAPTVPTAPAAVPHDGQQSYVHTLSSLASAGIKPGDLMMTTYATGGVREMLHNWVLNLQLHVTTPMLVAAMDSAVVAQCSAERFHCLDWSRTEVSQDGQYNRGDFAGFRALGVRKVDALLSILRAGAPIERRLGTRLTAR